MKIYFSLSSILIALLLTPLFVFLLKIVKICSTNIIEQTYVHVYNADQNYLF